MKIPLALLALAWLLTSCGQNNAVPTPAVPAALPTRTFDPTGVLLFIQIEADAQRLVQLDTATGGMETLFTAPAPGLLSATAVFPSGDALLVAYAPAEDGAQRGDTELYILPRDGSAELLPLVTRQQSDERFLYPTFSPDGRYLYFNHVAPADDGSFATTLERLDMQAGTAEVIARNALMPALSPDGRSLAYVAVDPATQQRTLIVAAADGSNPQTLLETDDLAGLAHPVFGPDDQMLYVAGAAGPEAASVQNPPVDWWRVDLAGGRPALLEPLQLAEMAGAFSPDGRYLAFAGQAGVFLMHPDGNGVLPLLDVVAASDVSWLPAPPQ